MSMFALALISQPFNHLHAVFLPLHEPTPEERADPILFAGNVQQELADQLGVPTTQHSYEDVFFMFANRIGTRTLQTFRVKALRDLFGMDLTVSRRCWMPFVVPIGTTTRNWFCRLVLD